ncbi:MAG TPA: cytochrome b/b6 domain-containing protein [Wenzhouxiangella sp.]|nr:cytochrome b/b6 domain-containing protein [Wenzhouxiangella sp.]
MPDTNRYSGISIINHWLTAVLVVIMLLIGFAAAFAPEKDIRSYLMGIHVSVGFFVLLFVLWRVIWRLYEGFPANVGPTAGERWGAWLVHRLILISLVVQVLSGPLAIFLGGHAVNVFGWFSFRIPVGESEAVQGILGLVHVYNGLFVLPILLGLHVLGGIRFYLFYGRAAGDVTKANRQPEIS